VLGISQNGKESYSKYSALNQTQLYVCVDKLCSYRTLIYIETSTDTHLEMSDLKAFDEWVH
jgi:hypothetical protein